MRCTGVILAGGDATRFDGEPKGLERVGGARIIDRVALALAGATDSLLLVANDPLADGWLPGVRTEPDVRTGMGALGGIHAALVRAGTPVLVAAWDMPFLPGALLRTLRAIGEVGADVALPASDSRRGAEPLSGYYSPACIAPIERALERGDRHIVSFFDEVRFATLPLETVARFGDPQWMFLNVNTPGDLVLAERHASTPDAGDRRPEAPR